jgi:hypothetical protein
VESCFDYTFLILKVKAAARVLHRVSCLHFVFARISDGWHCDGGGEMIMQVPEN